MAGTASAPTRSWTTAGADARADLSLVRIRVARRGQLEGLSAKTLADFHWSLERHLLPHFAQDARLTERVYRQAAKRRERPRTSASTTGRVSGHQRRPSRSIVRHGGNKKPV